MRFGIQGWGSEGDLRPLVALAARLRARGHDVRMVFTPVDGKDHRAACEAIGASLRLVPEHMTVTLHELVRDANAADPRKLLGKVLELTFDPHVEAMHEAALDLCDASDVVVAGPTCWTLKAAAIARQKPFATIDYVPGLAPSKVVPPAIFPEWRWLARPTWAVLGVMMDMAFRDAPRKFFAARGLPPIRHTLPDVVFSDALALHAASPSFWPPSPDWSDNHCVCGELVMPDEIETWEPSPELRAFLDAGPAPLLFTLGSWEHMAPARIASLLVDAAHATKRRAIVQTKIGAREERDGDVFVLPWAPHRRLAPRCSAILHHGGAGTTHMALRAGKPALVLPFILEQRMWAQRVARVGAGRWLSFWKATPEKIGALAREVADSETLRAGAERMSSAMATEDGAAVASARLEALATQ